MKLVPRDESFFLDDVFGDFLSSKDTANMKCDIYEKGDKYYIEMDTPGYSKDDTTIECDNGYLTVKVSKKEESSDEEKNYIRRERSTREYSRSFYVGDVDPESIKASFKNGCLTVEVPKEEKKETKKLIQIEEK
ncbi:heat shock protein Hsp20 [Clostridium sp. CAG:710]|jgi:heat shock protein hsp20|nr:Hsp20/alpha crystallin family protein [Clostridium sp.]CCZ59990.1 heat shock protein Hsp20 [Clostridium sp. CAG:710]